MTLPRPQHHTTSRLVTQTLRVYERDAPLFVARWGKKRYKRPAFLSEWLALLPRRAVLLDLGCGVAQDARYFTTVGHRVVGLDRAFPLLRFGRQCSPSVPLVLADMRFLPLRSGSLDGIWAAASLIHVPKAETVRLLTELRRRLKPGGTFAATLTYGNRSRIRNDGWMPGRYFARWRKDELIRAVGEVGWDVLSLKVVANRERKGRWLNLIARKR